MSEYNINSQFTLLERAKRSADGKRIQPIIDVMDKLGVQDFLKDVPYFMANQGLKHRIVRTVSRPSSTRRNFYEGVGSNITTTQVIYEPVVLFEQRSEIDEDELDTVENPKELRQQEDEGHIKGLMEDFVTAMFTDAKTSGSEYIDGFVARLGTLSYPGHTTETLPYVWDNGGAATCSSMYIVEWGPRACHALYPSGRAARGTMFGIAARDKGREKILDSSDKAFYGYVSQFKKWCGLAIHNDWKFTRIANVVSAIGDTNSIDEDVIIQAINHGKFNIGASRIYVNPYIKSQIDKKVKDKASAAWSIVDTFGKSVPAIWGIPVRVLDESILPADESAVS